MIWRDVAALSAAVIVAGCASTKEVLADAPTEVFKSTKSADEVSFCLADRNNTPPLPRDDGGRVILIKNGYGAVSLAFTVYPDGSGSRIEYRRKFGTVGAAWKRCIGLKEDKD